MDPHVAVLVLDTPIAGVTEIFGDFGDNIIDLLSRETTPLVKYQIAFDVSEDPAENEPHIARAEENLARIREGIAAGSIKGVVLSGSRSDSFAVGNPWIERLDEFIKSTLFAKADFPIVGLCFGHQILAKNMGCKVNRNAADIGQEIGTSTISLNKSILDVPDSPFRSALVLEDGQFLEHINLMEYHHDIVFGLPTAMKQNGLGPTTFQNLGSTPKCSIQGLVTESGPLKILTFQGHPEFTTEMSLHMLKNSFEIKRIDNAVFERSSYSTSNLENHGYIIGKVIQNFIDTYK